MKTYKLGNSVELFINYFDGIIRIMVTNYNDDHLIVRYSEEDFLDIINNNFADVVNGEIIIENALDEEDGSLVLVHRPVTLHDYIDNYMTEYEAKLLKQIMTNFFITSTITN